MPTAPLETSTISRPAWRSARHALDQPHHATERQLDAVVGHDVRAELDHDAMRIGELFPGRRHGRET